MRIPKPQEREAVRTSETFAPPQVVYVEYTPYGRLELAFDQLMLIPDLPAKLLLAYERGKIEKAERRKLNTYGDRVGV